MTNISPALRRLAGRFAAVALLAVAPAALAREPAWVGAWAAAQQIPEPRNALPAEALTDATLRQVVRVTAGGPRIRIRLSNVHGTGPLTFSRTHVAKPLRPGSPAIDCGLAIGPGGSGPLVDLLGVMRPFGIAPDCGAYEWTPVGPTPDAGPAPTDDARRSPQSRGKELPKTWPLEVAGSALFTPDRGVRQERTN